MRTTIPLHSWLRFTIFNGLAVVFSYTAAAFIPLPEKISLMAAFVFGPFFLLTSVGLYFIIRSWKESLMLVTGTIFNIVGTSLVTLMLVVQQTIFSFHDKFKSENRGTVSDEQLKWMFKEVNSVQLGIDIAWDLFISSGTFFLALAIWRHPVYGRAFSITGMLVSVLLLSFNMISFPVPPEEAGLIDFGPFVALWYFTLILWTWIKKGKFD